MKILFDVISLQGKHNGGEEYTRKVLYEILKYNHINIIGIYDSKLKFLDNDWELLNQTIKLYDIQKNSISEIVKLENIDKFYIGIGQRYLKYDLNNINCKVICTIHDIFDIELFETDIFKIIKSIPKKNYLKETFKRIINKIIKLINIKHKNPKIIYKNLINLLNKKDNIIITVSSYSKMSIYYFIPELSKKEIKVLYSPSKINKINENFENKILQNLDFNENIFLLAVSSDRPTKNVNIILESFKRILDYFPNIKLILTSSGEEFINENIIKLDYISTGDLELLYSKVWALIYPSLLEGFGYPPLEAMKYGTPVISSNVSSMPEILGDDVLFFSPFYPNDLFDKIFILKENYEIFRKKAKKRSEQIRKIQEIDLKKLIEIILE